MTTLMKQVRPAIGAIATRAALGLALVIILYKMEVCTYLNRQIYVSSAKARFVLVTSECMLGSGFLTGYREGGKAEVITAYHIIRCGRYRAGEVEDQNRVVQVDGLTAEIGGADPQRDLLRLLVPIHKTVARIDIRTESNAGEAVFVIGSNPRGDRSVITWGNILITPPGEVTAKAPIVPGTSGGQLISAVDGALLGMAVREGFGFTDAVNGDVLLRFLERTRRGELN